MGLHANLAPADVAGLVARNVGTCWFDGSREAFEGYSYAPELSSDARPRVLIVDKDDPAGLPSLVIEVHKAKRGSDVRLFGPLMNTDEGPRIRADVAFWAGGGRTCR